MLQKLTKIAVLTLMIIFIISCNENSDSAKHTSAALNQHIKGKVVPSENLNPPEVFELKETKFEGYTPSKVPRIDTKIAIKPSKQLNFILEASTILNPRDADYPISKKMHSKPERMQKPRAGKATRQKYTDGKTILFSEQDGMELPGVNALVEGPKGAIWGCSRWGGMWKYDGYNFHHFDESTGLHDYAVSNLLFDRDGELWIGMSTGLGKFDGASITHYTGEQEISQKNPTRLTEDTFGNIWVGSSEGLQMINKKTNQITSFTEDQGLSKLMISNIITDHLGRIWMTYNHGGYSILTIEVEDESYKYRIDNYTSEDDTFNLKLVQQVIETKNNRICIASHHDLIIIDNTEIKNPRMQAITYDRSETKTEFNAAIAEDQEGNLWLAGLYAMRVLEPNPALEYTSLIRKNYYSLRNESITSILIDKDNFLWMGLQNRGLNRVKIKPPLYSVKDDFGIDAMSNGPLEDQWGNIWFYTQYLGLHCLKKTKEGRAMELLRYDRSIFDNSSWPLDIKIDKSNTLWMTTGLAMYKVELFNQGDSIAVKSIKEKSGNVLIRPNFLLEDKEGYIWVTENTQSINNKSLRSSGGGFFKLDKNTLIKYGKEQGLLSSNTYSICQDQEGSIWLNSLYYGLTRFEPNLKNHPLGRWTHFTTTKDFRKGTFALLSHPENGIFLHSTSTILLESSDTPEIITKKDWTQVMQNEKSLKEIIPSKFISDSNDGYWFGYKDGIVQVENKPTSQNSKVSFYSLLDGFQDRNTRTVMKDKDGIIWAMGDQDLIGLDPQKMEQKPIVPATQLTTITQSDQVYNFSKDLDLKFTYQENYLHFKYHAIDVNRTHKLEYQYRLDGYESDWNPTTKAIETSYPNLPHGSYRFQVASRIENGEWGSPATLSFKITPPWWQSKIAYILYITFGLLAMTWIWRDQLNRIRVKNQIEKELLEAEKIREIDEVKTRFFTNMSHEYRTPLTVILGMTEELKEDNLAKKLIKQSGQNLLRLVNQMLDFSKLEDGQLALNLKTGEFISFAQYLLESFQSLAEHKNITLHFESSIKALHMPFDEDKVQHIISNLLSNAIKFTPMGGQVFLTVSEKNDQLNIKVKDTGIGIPSDNINKVFDRFYQIQNELSQGQAGTGIGLSFTKEIVEMMKGSISVKSEVDHGSTFTVMLPIPQSASHIPHTNETSMLKRKVSYEGVYKSPSEISEDIDVKEKPQLLLVEDNPEVVAYIKAVLKSDYEIAVGIDGEIGIKKAIDLIPDIIISDVMMPFKNGYEVASILKKDERTSHIPIIMLTAKADQDSKIEGLESGADAYLAKPFDKKELKIRLQNMIDLCKKYQTKYSRAAELPSEPISNNIAEKTPTKVVDIENIFLQKINALIDQHMDDAGFLVDELAKEVGMNRSQLYRKLKALTGKSTVAYLRSRRLHEARRLLLFEELNVSEVGYQVGFSTPSYFSKAFSKEFGYSPTEVKRKNSHSS